MSNKDLLESTWSDKVANDPKHRPQFLDRPATTVRKEWCRRPQEAHLADGNRYRRLSVREIAIIQGFDPAWVDVEGVKENDRIAVLGNAVSPPLAAVIGGVLNQSIPFQNETLIEICAGIGGLSSGFEFLSPIAKIEMWDVACNVLRENKPWPAECVVEGKAQDFDFAAHKGKVGLLCGGPPCQPWSQAGVRKGAADPRDVMGFTPDAIEACEPEVFLFENVPGLISAKENQAYLRNLLRRMSTPGKGLRYGISFKVFNTADYGVPQARRRVFILGIKNKSNTFAHKVLEKVETAATHHDPKKPAIGKKPWVTLGEAFDGVPVTESWRKWNVAESDGQEFFIEEADIESAPIDLPATLEPLSATEIDIPADRIMLLWPGKNQQLSRHGGRWEFENPSGMVRRKSLLFIDSIGEGEGTGGLAVLGEYSESLDALGPFVKGAGRMVYFDSHRISSLSNETDPGFVNSIWLSIVRDVAISASKCVGYDGVFILQTDEESAHYGRMVLDEVFGSNSHVTTFAWQKKYAPQNDLTKNTPTDAFDYIIVYSRCHKDIIPKVGLHVKPDDIIDDGDWRGCFTAGHKGAKSGSERTKFKICVPPYRWDILESSLPEDRYWFDGITGVLWYDKVQQSGDFWINVQLTDSDGNQTVEKIDFKIRDKQNAQDRFELPKRIWWLLEKDNDIKTTGSLKISKDSPVGISGEPFSMVLKATGGTPFKTKKSAPGAGRFWEFSSDTLIDAIATASAWFGKKGTALPSRKTYHDRENALVKKAVMNWLPWQDYGKSEDATRHLKALAAKNIIDPVVIATAKPERLLFHLISLFAPNPGDIVISLGDPNASMASVAIKSGRYSIHISGGSEVELGVWERVAKPRLEYVLQKQDDGGINAADVVEGFIQSEPGPVCVHRVSSTILEYDMPGTVVRVTKAGDEDLSEFYAGIVGCSNMKGESPWYSGPFGQISYVLKSDEILDHTLLSRISRHIPEGKKGYVVAERSDIDEGVVLPSNLHFLHAPFDMTGRSTA